MRKKMKLGIIGLLSIMLIGCSAKEPAVEKIPYNPYGFTAKQFVEEGGWDVAKEAVLNDVGSLFCEGNNIVLESGDYSNVLTDSGDLYDFENASVLMAVFGKGPSEANSHTSMEEGEMNWLDIAINVPTENSKLEQNVFIVHMPNIVRTEDGIYTGTKVLSNESDSLYLFYLEETIEQNYNFIINDGEVKDTLDYGILEYNEEIKSISKTIARLEKHEAKRIEEYLLTLEKNSSSFFSTGDSISYGPEIYISKYDEEKILTEITSMSEMYGFNVIGSHNVPEKERKMKKAGWTVYSFSYLSTDDEIEVQKLFRSTIENMYVTFKDATVAFKLVKQENENKDFQVILYIYVNPDTTLVDTSIE